MSPPATRCGGCAEKSKEQQCSGWPFGAGAVRNGWGPFWKHTRSVDPAMSTPWPFISVACSDSRSGADFIAGVIVASVGGSAPNPFAFVAD